jgi:hypothetical protein
VGIRLMQLRILQEGLSMTSIDRLIDACAAARKAAAQALDWIAQAEEEASDLAEALDEGATPSALAGCARTQAHVPALLLLPTPDQQGTRK